MSKYIFLSRKEARLRNLDKHGYYTRKDRQYLLNEDWISYSMPIKQQIYKANQSIFDTDKLKARLEELKKEGLDQLSLGNKIHQEIADGFDMQVLSRPDIGKSSLPSYLGTVSMSGTIGDYDIDKILGLQQQFYNPQACLYQKGLNYPTIVREVCNNSLDNYKREMLSFPVNTRPKDTPQVIKSIIIDDMQYLQSLNQAREMAIEKDWSRLRDELYKYSTYYGNSVMQTEGLRTYNPFRYRPLTPNECYTSPLSGIASKKEKLLLIL